MKTAELASARTCYGHLPGRAGVDLLDAIVTRGLLRGSRRRELDRAEYGRSVQITATGAAGLARAFGLRSVLAD